MNERAEIIEEMKSQIREILRGEGITFGMALSAIRGVEAEILRDGDTFLKGASFKNVSP